MREFLKEKRTIKKLVILAGFLALIFTNIILFNVILNKPLNFTYAAETIIFQQEITPFNPVEEEEPAKKNESKNERKDLRNSDHRIIVEITNQEQEEREKLIEKQKTENRISSRIINFSGHALYPNSEIFLEIHSDGFFTSTFSDNQADWKWTNYGHPLEDGEHSIEAYNFSPVEISGKRDVFAQKYFFTVADEVNGNENEVDPESLSLKESYYQEKIGDDDLGDRLAEKSANSTYLFNAVLLNKKEYGPGDNIDLQLIFTPLTTGLSEGAKVNYILSNYEWNGVLGKREEKQVSQFSDDISLENGGSFLKRIDLRSQLIPGEYLLKITPQIGEDKYVQAIKFSTVDRPVIQVGSTVMTEEKFSRMIILNIIFSILLSIAVILIIILEYKRFVYHKPIDERALIAKGFFRG